MARHQCFWTWGGNQSICSRENTQAHRVEVGMGPSTLKVRGKRGNHYVTVPPCLTAINSINNTSHYYTVIQSVTVNMLNYTVI